MICSVTLFVLCIVAANTIHSGFTQQIVKLPPKIAVVSGAGWAYNAYKINEMQNPSTQENDALKFQYDTYLKNNRLCKNICLASSSIAVLTRVGAYSIMLGTMWAISRSSKNLK